MTILTLDPVIILGALITYCGTLIFYRLSLHPLAKFPGPRLAAISRWYEAYYDVILPGQYTLKIRSLHRTYGLLLIAAAPGWGPG